MNQDFNSVWFYERYGNSIWSCDSFVCIFVVLVYIFQDCCVCHFILMWFHQTLPFPSTWGLTGHIIPKVWKWSLKKKNIFLCFHPLCPSLKYLWRLLFISDGFMAEIVFKSSPVFFFFLLKIFCYLSKRPSPIELRKLVEYKRKFKKLSENLILETFCSFKVRQFISLDNLEQIPQSENNQKTLVRDHE